MAVPVQQRLLPDRREWERVAKLFRDDLLEHQRSGCKNACVLAPDQRRNLVAEPDQAAWLEPDHRDVALHIGREGVEAALRLVPRLLDRADREERAPAAQGPVIWAQQVHPAASRFEHSERSLDILRLEIAAERIHEQHDLAAVL